MYFNHNKERRIGEKLTYGKLKKKIHKSVEQLQKHDPEVRVSEVPTTNLLVSNSSILCDVSPEEVEDIFSEFDSEASYVVYPNKRSYSFVTLSTIEKAVHAREELNGFVHPKLKKSHQPFVISFVENLPNEKQKREQTFPTDLVIREDFLSDELEQEIADLLLKHPKNASLKHRSVIHFEHEFDYGTNAGAKVTEPAPELIRQFAERLVKEGITTEMPDQITANIYEPGQGIPSHYDTHSAFEDPVISLSLLSDVVMEFKDGANSARIAPVLLKRKSLCVIQGESRYKWKHGIVNRNYDVDPVSNKMLKRELRISLTFRKIRHEPCQCDYKEFCDWDRKGEMGIPNSETAARKLEDNYVSEVYEKISSHFDETRHSSWKAVKKFLESLPDYSVMYDVGCGNGKYLIANDKLIKIGCDMCNGLCSIAYRKNCHVCRADGLHLPFKDNADAVISIAVLHHMSSFVRRQQLIKEILRVLKPGGRACITVWSMDQSDSEYAKMRNNKDETEVLESGTERLKIHDGKNFAQQDVLVPWIIEAQNETFLRFYHVFREGEMEELINSVDGCRLESVEKEQGNYIAIFEKL
ncbi:unnamed protein product [Auanema sp. JU1783]|nr:unnamed protein product [Auanema sp. JU1783]